MVPMIKCQKTLQIIRKVNNFLKNYGGLGKFGGSLGKRMGRSRYLLVDSFTICYLRSSSFSFDTIFSLHSFNVNIQVQFTHTTDNSLKSPLMGVTLKILTWLLSLSSLTLNVGSSFWNLLSALENEAPCSFFLTVMAKDITGSGICIDVYYQ